MASTTVTYAVGDTVNLVQHYHGTAELKTGVDYKVRSLLGNSVWLEPNKTNPVKPIAYIADKFIEKPITPTIKTQPKTATVTTGDPLTLTAVASGSKPMTWVWKKDGSPINGATGTGLTATYTKAVTDAGDAGSYTCEFTNSVATKASNAAVITIS